MTDRTRIYDGGIDLHPATRASEALLSHVDALVRAELAWPAEPRLAQFDMPAAEHFACMQRVRAKLVRAPEVLALQRALVREIFSAPAQFAIDALRLRAILHDGHENPTAAP